MDLKAWVEVGSLMVAFAALILTNLWSWRQNRNTLSTLVEGQKTNCVTNLWKFCDAWDSEEMHEVRGRAAQALQESSVRYPDPNTYDVLNFFEKLGFLLRKKAIDIDAAWSMFSDWALPYHKAAAEYIATDQKKRHGNEDPTIWEDFGYLYESLLSIEVSRRTESEAEVEAEIDKCKHAFLTAEAKLASKAEAELVSKPGPQPSLSPEQGVLPSRTSVPGAMVTRRTFSAWRY